MKALSRALLYSGLPIALSAQVADLTYAEKIRASMEASLEKQRASVRIQAEKTQTVWVSPVAEAQAPEAAPQCEALPEAQLATLVDDAARRESLKPALLRAVISKESGGRPCAVSAKGAQGLMQIMPATAELLKVVNPFDPKQNVDAGSRFLKQLLDKYGGDLPLALGAYNAGPARVDRDGGVPQIAETQSYVADILSKVQ